MQQQIGRNDPCICGSGKKYKKCCADESNSEQIRPDIEENIALIMEYRQSGKQIEALEICKYLLEYYPKNTDILYQTAEQLSIIGQFDSSIGLLNKAILINPKNAKYYFHLADIYKKISQAKMANIVIDKAIALDKDNPDYLYFKADLLQDTAIFEKIIHKYPKYFYAYKNLYSLYNEIGEMNHADEVMAKLELQNPSANIRVPMMLELPIVNLSKSEILKNRDKLERNLEIIAKDPDLLDAFPTSFTTQPIFLLNYHGMNNKAILEKFATLIRNTIPFASFISPHIKSWKSKATIKTAIISENIKQNHPVMIFFGNLIENIAKDKDFSVTLFDIGGKGNDLEMVRQGLVDHVILPKQGSVEMCEIIASYEQDIIIYLDLGTDIISYVIAFARLAPIQLALMGVAGTSGISSIDYFISTDLWESEGAQDHYTEKLLNLTKPLLNITKPNLIANNKYDRKFFGFPENGHLYAVPAILQKIHPDLYDILTKIIEKDEDAKIIFFKNKVMRHEILESHLQNIIPNAQEKIIFANWIEPEDFIYAISLLDVIIDPVHFGMPSSMYKIFAAGTPVVTWKGEFMAGRVTAGLYQMMQIEGLVADNFEEYTKIATKLAKNKEYNHSIRKQILNNNDVIYNYDLVPSEFKSKLKQLVNDYEASNNRQE